MSALDSTNLLDRIFLNFLSSTPSQQDVGFGISYNLFINALRICSQFGGRDAMRAEARPQTGARLSLSGRSPPSAGGSYPTNESFVGCPAKGGKADLQNLSIFYHPVNQVYPVMVRNLSVISNVPDDQICFLALLDAPHIICPPHGIGGIYS